MFNKSNNADKHFLEAFHTLSEAARAIPDTALDPERARHFIEDWQRMAEQAVLTANLYSLRLMLDSLRNMVKHHPEWKTVLCRYAGRLAWISGDYPQAQHYFTQALVMAQAQGEVAVTITAQLDLAEVLLSQGWFLRVEKLLKLGLEFSYQHHLELEQLQILNRLGRLYHYQQDWEISQTYLGQAFSLLEAKKKVYLGSKVTPLKLHLEEAFNYHWLGTNYLAVRQWSEAETYLSKSLNVSNQHRNVLGIAETLLKLGMVYNQDNHHDSALLCFNGSLVLCEQLYYLPLLLQAYYYKGLTYCRLGQYQEALSPARRAVELGLETEQTEWLARAFYNLGQVYHHLKEPKLALACHLRSAELYLSTYQQPQWIEILIDTGNFLLSLQDQRAYWEQALECYRKAISLMESNQKLEHMAPVVGKMARAFTKVNGMAGLEDAARCYRLQLQLAGDLDSVALPPKVAVAMRVEALTGILCCSGLRINQSRLLGTPVQTSEPHTSGLSGLEIPPTTLDTSGLEIP
ncbi:MAG: tetratricopeptide repeat protein, partial [Chloroflexi bacterium]|nr:tetratricopeptide repeat protein [Chloroflexota bacterium]